MQLPDKKLAPSPNLTIYTHDQHGSRQMLKESIKRLLHIAYKPFSFHTRRLLANSLLYSILRSSSDDALRVPEGAFANIDVGDTHASAMKDSISS